MSTTPEPDSSRSGQKPNTDDDDRISDLPDSILGNILSFLPTNNAVATAILSKRWKSLWTLAANLHFRCPQNYTGSVEHFVQFVNYVLLFHKHGCFQSLRLTWLTGCIPFYVNTWIGVALDRDACGLFVSADISELPNQLQSSLFSSETLESLVLDCSICIPSSDIVFNLPRLERLILVLVYIHNVEDIGKILSGCPVLKSLIIHMDVGKMAERGYVTAVGGGGDDDHQLTMNADGNPITCMISSASLTHLEISLDASGSSPLPLQVVWDAKLDVPSLQYIELDGYLLGISVQQRSLALLDEANIGICGRVSEQPLYCNSVVKAFSAFSCAKTLTLRDQAIRVFGFAKVQMNTKFNRLTRLEVFIDGSYWSSLKNFIMLSDNLEVLIVDKEDAGLDTNDVPLNNNSNSNQEKHDLVPKCLSKSLRTVLFYGYCGHRDELEMMSYIMKHARVLKIMKIGFERSVHNDFKRKCELVQKICAFPRKSTVCEVKFHDSR